MVSVNFFYNHVVYNFIMKYTFPERLKELRLENNMSINELAKQLGVSPIAISRWENNLRVPNIINLYSIAKFFDVSADYLIGLEDYI